MIPAPSSSELENFPGWEIVEPGLADAAAGRVTVESCVVWINEPRLRRYGLLREENLAHRIAEPELVLYGLLGAQKGDAYGRYNSILRRVDSFGHALDRAYFHENR